MTGQFMAGDLFIFQLDGAQVHKAHKTISLLPVTLSDVDQF